MSLDGRAEELVSIAAAVAGNCMPCFSYHLNQSRRLGISVEEIEETVGIARKIRSSGTQQIDNFVSEELKLVES